MQVKFYVENLFDLRQDHKIVALSGEVRPKDNYKSQMPGYTFEKNTQEERDIALLAARNLGNVLFIGYDVGEGPLCRKPSTFMGELCEHRGRKCGILSDVMEMYGPSIDLRIMSCRGDSGRATVKMTDPIQVEADLLAGKASKRGEALTPGARGEVESWDRDIQFPGKWELPPDRFDRYDANNPAFLADLQLLRSALTRKIIDNPVEARKYFDDLPGASQAYLLYNADIRAWWRKNRTKKEPASLPSKLAEPMEKLQTRFAAFASMLTPQRILEFEVFDDTASQSAEAQARRRPGSTRSEKEKAAVESFSALLLGVSEVLRWGAKLQDLAVSPDMGIADCRDLSEKARKLRSFCIGAQGKLPDIQDETVREKIRGAIKLVQKCVDFLLDDDSIEEYIQAAKEATYDGW